MKRIRWNEKGKSTWLLTAVAAIFFISVFAFGQEAAHEVLSHHEEEHGIPKMVFHQAVNFFGLLVILFFLLRKKVSSFFSDRHKTLTAAIQEAQKIKQEAQLKHQEYTVKIQHLEKEADAILVQIRRDGEDSKRRIIEEATKQADAIRAEARRTVENEVERARVEIYEEVLDQALIGARSLLDKSVVENDQRRLQKEFVEKIEAVQ